MLLGKLYNNNILSLTYNKVINKNQCNSSITRYYHTTKQLFTYNNTTATTEMTIQRPNSFLLNASTYNPVTQRRYIQPTNIRQVNNNNNDTTQQKLDFTILSYNILAQTLIRRDQFPWCSKQTLKVALRKQNILNELLHYKPTVFCLQEVDGILYKTIYDEFCIRRRFQAKYVVGSHIKLDDNNVETTNEKLHGLAIFYDNNVFDCVDYQTIELNDQYRNDNTIVNAPEWHEFNRSNSAQILFLQPKQQIKQTGYGLCITNTHLFYHPMYNYVRLIQCDTLLQSIVKYNKQYNYCVISCGDWNTTPEDYAYNYLTHKRSKLNADQMIRQFRIPIPIFKKLDIDIENTDEYTNQRLQQLVDTLNNSIDLPVMQSSYAHYTDIIPDDIIQHTFNTINNNDWCLHVGEPPFTNYVQNWKGTLDYIMTIRNNNNHDVTNNINNSNKQLTESISTHNNNNDAELCTNTDTDTESKAKIKPHACCTNLSACTHNVFLPHHSMSTTSMLQCKSILELPSESSITVQTALPNEQFSSDHLCISAKYTLSYVGNT